MHLFRLKTSCGVPTPLGTNSTNEGVNFSLYSENAANVTLCLFKSYNSTLPFQEISLDPIENKTGNIWHIFIEVLPSKIFYLYRIEGHNDSENHFYPKKYLLDPYASEVLSQNTWGANNPYTPIGSLNHSTDFDWKNDASPQIPLNETIIYEMHVRGLTQDASSNVKNPGSYLGVIEKIPHLIDLGITSIELLPVHEFNECEYSILHFMSPKPLYNYWGYSTVNFFSPMQRYASTDAKNSAVIEFKTMVRELHKNGIEIILDVVYNHTAEGNKQGPVISWKGIDNSSYYLLDGRGDYINLSGCGNTLNCGLTQVQEMILDSLRYWVLEMHVDGFRFDLTSILTRGKHGEPLENSPLIDAITNDPILAKVKLIAEPWDAGGLYQVGNYFQKYKLWSEWNGRYRDSIRRFIRGGDDLGQFVTSLCGSQDMYYGTAPCNSINFITAHDGFTLADLVSYNTKHNVANGEDNRDGTNDNQSWNCGSEGPTTHKLVLSIRSRQMRNFHLALMISRGTPMVLMGDEYGHTRRGNNNAWCQDNELNWFLWDQLERNKEFYRFYRSMIHYRKDHPVLNENQFFTNKDIIWHGKEPLKPNWSSGQKFIAFTIKDFENGNDLYIAFNADNHPSVIEYPICENEQKWHWVVNTASPSPYDFREESDRIAVVCKTYRMQPYSAIMLEAGKGHGGKVNKN